MQRSTVATIGSIIFIGVASALMFLRSSPEYVTVASEDGGLVVSGYAREGGITVTQAFGEAGDEWTVASGSVDSVLPMQLRFRHPSGPAWDGTENFDVLRYDDTLAMFEWQDVTTVDGYLIVATTHLGRFALADHKTVVAPDFMSEYDTLRATAPSNAVGYRIAVGATVGDGPIIRIDDAGQQGGCGGAVQPGNDTAYATSTRTASVLVDDVQTPVTFTFVASWYTVDGGSCPEGTSFIASDEYGILPSSR